MHFFNNFHLNSLVFVVFYYFRCILTGNTHVITEKFAKNADDFRKILIQFDRLHLSLYGQVECHVKNIVCLCQNVISFKLEKLSSF